MNDIIHWPMELRTDGSCFLLARCNDGHWRGRRGKEGIVPYGDFSETSVDVDLSDIEDAVPLGHYKQQRGKPPYPAYRMCFVNPADGARVYCGFTLAGRVDIEPLDEAGLAWLEGIAPESRNNEAVLNIVLYKSWPMSWIIDKQGFVVSIRRHEPIDETTFGKTPKSFSVADFLSRATCHSE